MGLEEIEAGRGAEQILEGGGRGRRGEELRQGERVVVRRKWKNMKDKRVRKREKRERKRYKKRRKRGERERVREERRGGDGLLKQTNAKRVPCKNTIGRKTGRKK